MSSSIHPTAIVHKNAVIGQNVTIGPFCVIGEHVVLESHNILHSHIVIEGNTTIGEGTEIFPFASIGHRPQDLKFKGEVSRVIIGRKNIIREHVTINPGTTGGGLVTEIGEYCLLMVGVHVAHDCKVGNHVIMANNATLGGHVHIGDFAVLGGLSAVHQFVRIGHHAMIGGMSGVESDVIPYGQAMGERAGLTGLNLVGMKRRGLKRDDINTLRTAYRLLFSPEGTFAERVEDARKQFKETPGVSDILDFIKATTSRPLCQPKGVTHQESSDKTD